MKQLNTIVALLKAMYCLMQHHLDQSMNPSKNASETITQLFNRKEAADYLLVDPKTITNWRKRNILPTAKHKGNTPKYHIDDLNRCYEWHWGKPKER